MTNKTTHTIQDIESLMYEYVNKIQNAETKTEKHALTKKLKSLEAHYNSCQDKNINGKKYPIKKKPVYTSKEELYKLIESVAYDRIETGEDDELTDYDGLVRYNQLDLTGAFISDDRTEDFPRTSRI